MTLRIGIDASEEIPIRREEIYQRIMKETAQTESAIIKQSAS